MTSNNTEFQDSRVLLNIASIGKQKTCVFVFARMNPPHSGHGTLLRQAMGLAKQLGGEARVYLSTLQDLRNPLNHERKMYWCRKSFPGVPFLTPIGDGTDYKDTFVSLYKEGFEHIVVVCGSDRSDESFSVAKQYNGTTLFNFKLISISVCDRVPGSGTEARRYVKEKKLDQFKLITSSCLKDSEKNILYHELCNQLTQQSLGQPQNGGAYSDSTAKSLHLAVANNAGSIQHYYHFILGFLFPILYWYCTKSGHAYRKIYIRSSGVMDKHIHSLGLKNILVVEKDVHDRLHRETDGNIVISAFDTAKADYSKQIDAVSRLLLDSDRIKNRFSLFGDCQSTSVKRRLRVLVVSRGEPDSFYSSSKSEIKSASNQRRSISNFDDLAKSIAFLDPKVVYLEQVSLVDQIALFRDSDIVIAQHGAALANIVFCRKSALIIEICPVTMKEAFERTGDDFLFLSKIMKLRFYRVWQAADHSDVDVAAFKDIVMNALSDIGINIRKR